MQYLKQFFCFLCLFGGVTLISGCDESVNPIVGEDRPVTLYGYLDPLSERQVLRLIPIEADIANLVNQNVSAQVRTTHIESGEVVEWQPLPATFTDSTTGTVFEAFFTPEFNHTYRLEVVTTEGMVSTAETTIPPFLEINQDSGSNPLRPSFFIPGDLPNLVQTDMVYEVVAMQPVLSAAENVLVPVRISYKNSEIADNGGWRLIADLRNDFGQIGEELRNFCITTPYIALRSSSFVFFVGDDKWVPPGGEFDPELLAQPGVFSNVENGFGYFGSGYQRKFQFRLSASSRAQIGFALDAPCPDGPADPNNPEPMCIIFEPCL